MITISFNLLDKPNSSVLLLELHNSIGQLHQLQTPFRIAKELWDQQQQRPHNIYLKRCKKLNHGLNRLRIKIAGYLESISWNFDKISLRALSKNIREAAKTENARCPEESLLWHMENYIAARSHLICKSTHRRYLVFYNLLERFEGHLMRHLKISEVNGSFVKEFLNYCKREAFATSTTYRTVNFIKTVLNHLEKRGIRTFAYELELPKERKQRPFVTLTEDELVKIKRMELPKNLQAARDWLIISCYTGQRVSDFMEFSTSKIQDVEGMECISFVQKKTLRNVILPLHPAVQVIKLNNNGDFPQKVSPKKYNQQIKEIVRQAGFDTQISIGKRTGFRVVTGMIPKWKAVTSHIGRRSFATNFYGKIPTSLLMEATGHSSEQMFQRYINHIDTGRISSLRLYFEEAYKNKFQD